MNDAGNGLLPGLVLNGSAGTLANSQCSVNGAGSSVGGVGNTLTLNLSLTFSASFSGNKIMYLAARDIAQNSTGWQALGVWNVPGGPANPLTVTSLNPARGSGSAATLTFTFMDTNGAQDLGIVNVLINNFLDGRQACYLAYNRALNVLYLVADGGPPALQGGLLLNGSGGATTANVQSSERALRQTAAATT